MIGDFYDTTFDIYRQQWSGNKSSESKVGSFSGHLQKADYSLTEHFDSSFTDTYKVWCSIDTDVQTGDTIDDGTYEYSVRDIKRLDFGTSRHKHLIAERATS